MDRPFPSGNNFEIVTVAFQGRFNKGVSEMDLRRQGRKLFPEGDHEQNMIFKIGIEWGIKAIGEADIFLVYFVHLHLRLSYLFVNVVGKLLIFPEMGYFFSFWLLLHHIFYIRIWINLS